MPLVGRVFDVCSGNCDTSCSFFRSFINGAIIEEAREALFGLSFGDCSGEGGFAMIDVANCTLQALASARMVTLNELLTYRCLRVACFDRRQWHNALLLRHIVLSPCVLELDGRDLCSYSDSMRRAQCGKKPAQRQTC